MNSSALPSVLIVDDDPLFRLLTRMLLESHGCEVSVAGDCEEALRVLHTAKPHLALVDMIMPGTDGLQTISALKSLAGGLRFIACSGHDEDLFRVDLEALSVPHFLSKPFTVDQLLSKMRLAAAPQPESCGV